MKKNIIILLLVCFLAFPVYGEDISFETLEGPDISYSRITASPKTVLFMWTTWCPYCLTELNRLAQKCEFYEGIDILYVNIGQNRPSVERFAKSKGLKRCTKEKILLDTNAFFAEKFSVFAIPAFVFLRKGEFVRKSNFLNEELIESIFGLEETGSRKLEY